MEAIGAKPVHQPLHHLICIRRPCDNPACQRAYLCGSRLNGEGAGQVALGWLFCRRCQTVETGDARRRHVALPGCRRCGLQDGSIDGSCSGWPDNALGPDGYRECSPAIGGNRYSSEERGGLLDSRLRRGAPGRRSSKWGGQGLDQGRGCLPGVADLPRQDGHLPIGLEGRTNPEEDDVRMLVGEGDDIRRQGFRRRNVRRSLRGALGRTLRVHARREARSIQ